MASYNLLFSGISGGSKAQRKHSYTFCLLTIWPSPGRSLAARCVPKPNLGMRGQLLNISNFLILPVLQFNSRMKTINKSEIIRGKIITFAWMHQRFRIVFNLPKSLINLSLSLTIFNGRIFSNSGHCSFHFPFFSNTFLMSIKFV